MDLDRSPELCNVISNAKHIKTIFLTKIQNATINQSINRSINTLHSSFKILLILTAICVYYENFVNTYKWPILNANLKQYHRRIEG